jgi:hypothetical protein
MKILLQTFQSKILVFFLFLIVCNLFPLFPVSASQNLSFPWEKNTSKQWWRESDPWHGGHDSNCIHQTGNPTKCAIDFGGNGSWKLITMGTGTITNIQKCTASNNQSANVTINHDGTDIKYMHLDLTNLASIIQNNNGNVSIPVIKGQFLGYTKTGNFGSTSDTCGYAQQTSNTSHVHLIIPTSMFTIDGWTFDYPSTCAVSGSSTICSGGNFTSQNIPSSNSGKYVPGDVDGDGKRDFTIFRSWSHPTWLSRMIPQVSSTNNVYNQSYPLPTKQMGNGAATDIPLPGDFDGDKKMDPGMYTPAIQGGTATWRIPLTSGAPEQVTYLGAYGDKPIVGDFDGDGKADPTVYSPSTGMWKTYFSSGIPAYTIFHGGWGEDIPMTGDYNNDGKSDYALYRPSAGAWYIYFSPATNSGSPGSLFTKMVGTVGDIPLSGDHDGDGKYDPSVYRPSTGEWFVLQSANNYAVKVMHHGGWSGDVPIYGDFDGDGKADPGIFRAISNTWYVNLTTGAPQIQLTHGGIYDEAI